MIKLSSEAWLAANKAAVQAIPILLQKELLQHAAELSRRATQFEELARKEMTGMVS